MTKKFKLSTDSFITDLNDDLVILELNSGKYFKLNQPGKCIVKLIEKTPKDIASICNELKDNFINKPEILQKQVENFLENSVRNGFVEESH
tara:strand:+ start:27248 stop:27520 length:273 start_codon:yes stop_codon:yes gene_type:complete